MKRVTFTAICAAALLSASAADYADYNYARVAEDVANRWQFTILQTYDWNDSAWDLINDSEYSYSPDGLVEVRLINCPDGRVMRQTNTYNSNGQLVEQVTEVATSAEGEFENSTRVVREYDERVPTFVISDLMETWKDGGWQLTAGYRNEVTRNEDGNVRMVEHSELTEGETEFRYTHILSIGYDSYGIASSVGEWGLTYDSATGNYYPVDDNGYTYADVKWAATDGQILSMEDLFEGPNRIESAMLYAPEDYEGPLSVTYGDKGSYEVSTRLRATDGLEREITELRTVTPLDDIGSVETVTERKVGSSGSRLYTIRITDTLKRDRFGLIEKQYVEEKYYPRGMELQISTLKDVRGQIEYDWATGYPLTWVIREYDDAEQCHIRVFKAAFGGFPNTPDAVEGIESDKAESIWYDLRGIRIAKPTTPGIYIERITGNNQMTVRKVVIK